jgi:tetratricopeptide (TPR) repeat protein
MLAAAGNMWIAAGQPAKAALALDKALAGTGLLAEQRGLALLDRARAAEAQGDLKTARAKVNAAVQSISADAFLWYFSAALAIRENDAATAKQAIGRALALEPNDPTVLFEAGHVFQFAGDDAKARQYWNRASTVDPKGKSGDAARRALAMMDAGDLDVLAAGHRPLLPVRGDEARGVLRGIVGGAAQFAAEVEAALRRRPEGVTIDDLAADLAATTEPGSIVALLLRLQFPVFATFFKLTLLNHCLLYDLPQGCDAAGRPTFRAA